MQEAIGQDDRQDLSPSVPEWRSFSLQPWRELAVFALMVMDVSWTAAWLRLAQPDISAPRAYLLLGGPLLFSYILLRCMQFLHIRLTTQRVTAVVFFLLSAALVMWAVFRPLAVIGGENWRWQDALMVSSTALAVVVFVLLALIFTRGAMLAGRWVGPQVVQGSFRLGVVAWAPVMALAGLELHWLLDVYLFLFAMLTASYAVRAAALSVLRGGVGLRLRRRWSLPLFAGAGGAALVMLGGLGAALLGPITARLMLLLLNVLFVLLLLLSLPLLALVLLVADRILLNPGMAAVIEDVAGRLAAAFQFILNFLLDLYALLADFIARLPDLAWARFILLAAAAGAALWFFAAQIRQRVEGGRRPLVMDEEHSAIQKREALRTGLGAGLARRLAALRARLAGRGEGENPAARIRRIYRDLLDMGAALGAPRARWQTPLEYRPVVCAALGGGEEDVALITQAYLAVRYGLLPEEDLGRVEAAWRALQARAADRLEAERLFARRMKSDDANKELGRPG